ncbi:uncharacterized protein LOC141648751 [Silene latifolia]|uniref:uncharacterized protein LOC141648751 n=1 Tax=Silene latifolia TaxID=37657 RepID=UPI003D784C12
MEQMVAHNDAILQVVQQMTAINRSISERVESMNERAENEKDGAPTVTAMFEAVQKKRPPSFTGKRDPNELDNWAREMEKIFLAVGSPVEFQARIAVYYLKEDVDIWWEIIKEDFMKPQTDDMSVKEFYTKFVQLNRFAEELVPTERTKAARFEDKLSWKIKGRFAGETFTTLKEVYARAVNIERSNQKMEAEMESVSNKRKEFQGSQSDTPAKREAGKPCIAPSASASVAQSNRFQGQAKSNNYNNYAGYAFVNNFKNPTPTQANITSAASKPVGQVNVAHGNKKPTGKRYVMNGEEAENIDIVSGNFSVNSVLAHVLFDCGASHSFISIKFVGKLNQEPSVIVNYDFVMPSRDLVNCEKLYKGVSVVIGSHDLKADLIEFPLPYFDVILGMDWLEADKASIDCW